MGLWGNISSSFILSVANQTTNQTNAAPPPAKEKHKPAKSKKKSDKATDAPPSDTEKISLNVESLKGMGMENLLQLREELLEKIRRIAETCEGIENEANARRITELNGRQAELLAQKDELKAKLFALDGELGTIGKNIQNLSGSGPEKILQAIKNQRWYFFKNKPKVLMDRDTALLWADLNYFPLSPTDDTGYNYKDNHEEKRRVLDKANTNKFGDCNDWKFPTMSEFKKFITSTTPHYNSSSHKLKDKEYWTITIDDEINGINLKDNSTSEGWWAQIIPCSHAYVPEDYENNISSSNNFYTDTEKLQFTLDIFVQNDLIPMFDDEAITHLYRTIFVDKPALLKQLAEVEAQIADLQPAQRKLTANFNYKPLLAKYDVAAIAKSPIKYFDAVLNVADEFLDILNEYETAQAETIAAFLKIALKLKAKYTDNPNLTPEENSLLAERQKFLAQRLELGTDEPKRKILAVKAQAENFFKRLEAVNAGDNSISDLAALQAEPRADFELLVENMARIILDTQRRVDFFAENKDLVASVVNFNAHWSDNYKAFKTSLREELSAACRNESIDDEIFAAWYDDWQVKRFAIEQRFLPLVEFAIKGNLIDAFDVISGSLQSYRDSVDKFYLHERKNIYQKFVFTSGGDLQEKFETESELYKLAEKLQRDLQGIIFSCDKAEERIFLLNWSEPLLNLPIDEISNFVRDKNLDAISEEVLTQFTAIKRQNFATYLSDSKTYSEAIQRREQEYNALIFRMRKDLHKS